MRMKEKVLCPFTGDECRFYKKPPNPFLFSFILSSFSKKED